MFKLANPTSFVMIKIKNFLFLVTSVPPSHEDGVLEMNVNDYGCLLQPRNRCSMLSVIVVTRRNPNRGMHSTLDPATERGLRPQPASASNVPDGKC